MELSRLKYYIGNVQVRYGTGHDTHTHTTFQGERTMQQHRGPDQQTGQGRAMGRAVLREVRDREVGAWDGTCPDMVDTNAHTCGLSPYLGVGVSVWNVGEDKHAQKEWRSQPARLALSDGGPRSHTTWTIDHTGMKPSK